MVGDKIANLINTLKTASLSNKETVTLEYSKVNEQIIKNLKKEDLISNYEIKDSNKSHIKKILVTLKYENNVPVIKGTKRISKLSVRNYKKSKDLKPVKRGYGKLIISTSKGVMTGDEAKKLNLGGEALFEIW